MGSKDKKKSKSKAYKAISAAVVMLAALVGVSGFIGVSTRKVREGVARIEVDTDVYESSLAPSAAEESAAPVNPQPDGAPAGTQPEPAAEPEAEQEEALEATAQLAGMVMPAEGDLLQDYSADKLVYSKTLGDWRAHSAIDIANKLGTPVKAAMDGTVERIENDALMGVTVVIKHSDVLETVYSNLQNEVVVAKGDVVKAGDVIGGVGSSAAAEALDSPHVHFEVRENGIPVNPYDFF